ncbi:peptidylprolyl isomerase [Coralliovum pocilloporae]|uniref:peptidylprolyl isomerase n=1 Tax=Coralliovum pocilloporae TaxID=3066369 RepID=UPI003306B373
MISSLRPVAFAAATLLTSTLAIGSMTGLASAEDSKIVAKVNGQVITESDIEFASIDFQEQLARVPEANRRQTIIDLLVDTFVFAEAAEGQNLDKNETFEKRMAFLRRRALRNAYFSEVVEKAVTDADIKARYDQEIGQITPEQETRARHILVKTEDEAKAIIKELDGGADFAELAKTKSTGPSGPGGGDLGYFAHGRMVKPFADAAFSMDIGSHSKEPVQTQFGWHVIKVEDRRSQELPSFEAVKDQVRDIVIADKLQSVLKDLKDKAKIEIIKPAE